MQTPYCEHRKRCHVIDTNDFIGLTAKETACDWCMGIQWKSPNCALDPLIDKTAPVNCGKQGKSLSEIRSLRVEAMAEIGSNHTVTSSKNSFSQISQTIPKYFCNQ